MAKKSEPAYKSDPEYVRDQIKVAKFQFWGNLLIALVLLYFGVSVIWIALLLLQALLARFLVDMNRKKLAKLQEEWVPFPEASTEALRHAHMQLVWRAVQVQEELDRRSPQEHDPALD